VNCRRASARLDSRVDGLQYAYTETEAVGTGWLAQPAQAWAWP
jgi:hypothetical protein